MVNNGVTIEKKMYIGFIWIFKFFFLSIVNLEPKHKQYKLPNQRKILRRPAQAKAKKA